MTQFIQTAVLSGGEEPKATSLEKLSQTIDQYTLLLWKTFYNTAEQAQDGGLNSVLCRDEDIIVGSYRVSVERRLYDVAAVMQSGICFHFLS